MSGKDLRLRVLVSARDQLSGPLKNIVGLGKSAAQKQTELEKEARDANKALQQQQEKIRRAMKEGWKIGDLVEKERELQKQVEETNRKLEHRRKINQINARTSTMKSAGADMRSSGTSDIMQGMAMAAPMVVAARSAMIYEKKLKLVAQKTDMNAEETKAFGKRVMATAAATGQLNDQLMEAVDWMGGKGVSVSAMDAMLPDIAKFATAWDAGVVDASKAAYAGYLSLKVPLKDTARSLEIMAAAGNAGGFEVKDMAQYFPELTSQLASFGAQGLSGIADLSSALQVLEAKTGDGSTAANNLKNLLAFAQSKTGVRNFQKVGIDIIAVMKKAEAEGGSAIDALIATLNKVTGGDASKIPQIISDMQAGSAARGLMESQEEFEEIRRQAFAAMGLTDKEYARMSETSEANWNRLQTALSGVSLTLGDKLLPHLTEGAKWITETVNAVAAWADKNPETAETLVKIAGGLVLAKIGMGALKVAVGTIIGPIGTLWGWWDKFKLLKEAGKFTTLATNVTKAGGALKSVGASALSAGNKIITTGSNWATTARAFAGGQASKAATGMKTVGYRALSAGKDFITMGAQHATMVKRIVAAKLASAGGKLMELGSSAKAMGTRFLVAGLKMLPILLVIGAIALAAYLIYKNWDGISAWFGEKWDQVKEKFSAAGEWIMEKWEGVKDFFFALPSWFANIGTNMIDGLKNGLANAFPNVLAKLRDLAKGLPAPIQKFLDIHSPSRLMMRLGSYTAEGMALGIERGSKAPIRAARVMAAGVAGASFATASMATPSAGSAAPMAPGVTMSFGNVTITINAAPGQSAQDIAAAVQAALQAQAAKAAAASRSSYRDD